MKSRVRLRVNGDAIDIEVDTRTLLVQLLREHLQLTGTHVGCDTAQCGACTVLLDGEAVKSCSVLAVQAEGRSVTTIEGIGTPNDPHPMQAAFRECHGLQCGYCTPGMILSSIDLLRQHPEADAGEIRALLDGNLCRCTGYHNIVRAIQLAQSSARAVRRAD